MTTHTVFDRRQFVTRLGLAAAMFSVPGLYAEELQRTPAQTEGPFYPDKLPLDTDNDLIVLSDSLTPTVGQVAYVSGRILGLNGTPVRNATVEIWQCDSGGAYLHSGTSNEEKRDKGFQGFGKFETGADGEYLFRTIKPVPYPGRTPHIHYKVKARGKELLCTQLYVKGHPGNERDGILRRLGDARDLVVKEFGPKPGGRAGELAARFDIVLGVTPEA